VLSSHAAADRRRALVAALAVTVLWSSSWVIIRVGLRNDRLPPLTFAGLRYVTAAAALWAAVAVNRTARGQVARLTWRRAGHLAVPTPAGLAACAVALAANAGAALLGRGINRACASGPLVTTTVSMTIGAVVLLAAGAAAEGVPGLSTEAVAMIAWLAVMNTAVAFTLWNFSLRQLTAGTSSVVNNAMLPQIGLLGWVVLGEAPGPWQWAGMILVSAGVAVAVSGPRAGPSGR
jgi:drug/metabolite transporter (DMT)-like permease